jgi:F-type H+-transporting ATPase subunit delta
MATGSAKRYVQALVELAREGQSFEAWQRDLGQIGQLATDPQTAAFLGNPSVQAETKFKAVDAVLGDVSQEARNLTHLLIERRRTAIIPEIVAGFEEAILIERGIVLADVTTAEPLDEAGQAAVRSQLERIVGKNIELRLHTDPEIIGGIVARIGDQLIDGSVINQLRRLRARLRAA